jgi:hypothetical protein
MVFVKTFLFSEKDKVPILLIFTLLNEKRTLSQLCVLSPSFYHKQGGVFTKTLNIETANFTQKQSINNLS